MFLKSLIFLFIVSLDIHPITTTRSMEPKVITSEITLSGVSKPLSLTEVRAGYFMVKANETNLGPIYIGDSAIDASLMNGMTLYQGEVLSFAGLFPNTTGYSYDLNQFYINGLNIGDKATVLYIDFR